MKNLEGTQTEQNLINAFAGESMARNRYSFFAKQAKKDGYEQIAEIFLLTAENEKEHAKLFYEFIGYTDGHVDSVYPFVLGNTEENLESAVAGEQEEANVLYANAEKTALAEGFDEIADTFHHVIKSEQHHAKRFSELLENIRNKTVFSKDKETNWLCRECGYISTGKNAPEECPNCHHKQSYFQILCEKY